MMRWGGSKWQRSREIVRLFPADVWHYVEPFAGYNAVFRRVMQMGRPFDTYHLNDINADLVAWMQAVRGDLTTHGDFIDRLADARSRLLPETEHEDEIRAYFEQAKSDWICEGDYFAWFFLHCYAVGQYVSRHRPNIASFDPGYFYHGLACETVEKAFDFRRMYQQATITCGNALDLLEELNESADRGHLVYLDPPYLLPDGSPGLYQHDMTREEHRRLAAILQRARFRFILSMGDYPDTRSFYIFRTDFRSPYRARNGFYCVPIRSTYCGHSYRGKRPKAKEWLILNYDFEAQGVSS